MQGYAKERCPNCFEIFSLKDSKFRCVSSRTDCSRSVDPVSQAKWEDMSPKGKVIEFPNKRKFRRSAECTSCKRKSNRRICPNCHSDLPPGFGAISNMTLAIVGAPASGKTHYIAALVNKLAKDIAPGFEMTFFAADEETTNRYRREYFKPLFEDHQLIEKTLSGAANTSVRKPLVYVLRNGGGGLFGDWGAKTVILSFFDSAGEDLINEQETSAYARHVIHSDAIIYLIDPLAMHAVKKKGGSGAANTTVAPIDILTSVVRLKETLGKSTMKLTTIRTPIAIATTKFDAVEKEYASNLRIHKKPTHYPDYKPEDAQTVSSEVESQIIKWDEAAFVNFVKTRFSDFHYFGVSALGQQPVETGGVETVSDVEPHRVEDPLLWLLNEKGIIQ